MQCSESVHKLSVVCIEIVLQCRKKVMSKENIFKIVYILSYIKTKTSFLITFEQVYYILFQLRQFNI